MFLNGIKKIQCFCRYLLLPGALISSVVSAQILEQIEVIEDVPGLSGVASIEITADGRHLYTASPSDEVIGAYARDASTGSLTLIETEVIDIGIGSPFSRPGPMLKLFQNERLLLVTRFAGVPPRLYLRSESTGELALIDDDYFMLADNERAISIAFSNQGDFLYVLFATRLATGAFDIDLRTYRVTPNGESSLVDTLTFDDKPNFGLVFISPDDRHVYLIGLDSTARLTRNTATGLLTLAGEEPELSRVRTFSPVFSSDGRRLYYRSPIGIRPFNILGTLLRDPDSGQVTSVLEETGLIDFNEDVSDDSMSLIANERLLVTHDGPNLFRLLPGDAGYIDLTDQIDDSLPTGPVGLGALEFSPDEAFMYLGLVSFMRDSDGIRIYRNNGLTVPQAVPVPTLGIAGWSLLVVLLLLTLGIRRSYFRTSH